MTLYKIEQGLKDVLTDVQLENSVLIQPSYFKDLVKLVAVIIGEANNYERSFALYGNYAT